jgi:hypothetical protein
MGRLIEEIEIYKRLRPKVDNGTLDEIMLDMPTVEAIPKDEYENRLKADLVAMLRFLWNDIENLDAPICDYASSDCISKWQVHEIIQQKINELKVESEAKVNENEK